MDKDFTKNSNNSQDRENNLISPPNFTQIPNIFFDKLMKDLGYAEMKVLLVIMRKTFGWHKIKDRISLSQIQELTGLARQHAIAAITVLETNKLILKEIEGQPGNLKVFYSIVVSENDSYVKLPDPHPPSNFAYPSNVKLPDPSNPTLPAPSNVKLPTKEKNKINKEIKLSLPTSQEAEEICLFFIECLRKEKPDCKIPGDLKKWRTEIDLMINKDGRSQTTIVSVIKWATIDAFWKTNIRCPSSLRDKFDRLELKMNSEAQPVDKSTQNTPSWVVSEETIQKRRNWAKRNEFYSQGGSATAAQETYSIISGSKESIYYYHKNTDFWESKGL